MPIESPSFEANSWPEFLSAVRQARQELQNPLTLWFRGHSKVSYELTPSLLRNATWDKKEQILFQEYERSAAHLLDRKDDSWEMLEDMQHYGIPTRLLDWTDVLGIAVAFALYESNDDADSAIYLLDPLKLNDKSGLPGIKRTHYDKGFDYKTVYWQGQTILSNISYRY